MSDEAEEVESAPSSVRRTLTLRSNAARQVAVNFLPSRQLPHSTIRRVHTPAEDMLNQDGDPADRQADLIVRELEQHPRLMQDAPDSDELRREALRDLPQGLTMKRTVRAKLSASVSLRSKRRPISFAKRIKYRVSFSLKRFKEGLRDFFFSIELWYEVLRNIEGQFGSAVGSYFRFLRWMFVADLVLAVFVVCLVIVPQSLYDAARNETVQRGFMDFVSGRGSFEDSLLFYGHYHDGYISASGSERYYMPFAYFFTMACLYLSFFGVLCYKTAYSYRHNFIAAGGAGAQPLATKLFCGWDFSIVSQHAASLHATSLFNEFKEILTEKNRHHTEASLLTKISQKLTNVLLSCLVVGVIAALEYSFWLLLSLKTRLPYWQLLVSFVITAAVALLPILFGFIVRLEFYTVRTGLYVTLARTWLLDMGTMMMLLVYWTRSGEQCWETRFGQETYRLVLLDAVVSMILLPAIEFLRSYVFKYDPTTSPPEFNIAYNSLTIIYNQVLLWLGMTFSPMLVVVVSLKFLLLFYVKRFCATHACQPARKVWRGAQTQTVLYMLVTLSLFATLFGLGSLFLGVSSHSCGPFRNYDYVYSVVSEGVLNLSGNQILSYVIHFVTRPGIIALLGLLLGVTVYYIRARALAQISMVEILRNMLVLQAKDKDFLLNAIAKVSNGEWMYSPRPDDETGPDSHTWKYLREVRKPSNADFHFDASRLSHSYNERPRSYVKENRPNSYYPEKSNEDGDTDSSFSWQGSNNYLNQKDGENGEKKLI